ncbi:hypothetical protein [Tranquillimonas alkanivorans]|uniref:Glycosyltransferase family 92 n=1 Tax=Tranquillimonas alkanivorans TaxID=441119 RepID=A0A1I5L6N9_9RHOB|nr:hypothetical protein [Tranquillimonas alkanivorans]SFO92852.1 hypothetical protein SAMN04488047_101491 [Tranquillimonas alkanivorans]
MAGLEAPPAARGPVIEDLSLLRLPETAPDLRDAPRGLGDTDERFWRDYDRRTLVYDCVHFPERGLLRLYTPRLFNLAPHLIGARFSAEGKPLGRPRRRTFRVFEHLDVRVDAAPSVLHLDGDHLTGALPVHPARHELFAGCNCLYTMVRDDDLAWVTDWARWHRLRHCADAALVVNNGSTAYTSADLAAALDAAGLARVVVVPAPVPNGPPKGAARRGSRAKFLQTAMLNLMRDRFLARARAVLNADVDELVQTRDGESVFDDAARSRWGYLAYAGVWRYAPAGSAPVRHADHALHPQPERPAATKYCVVPDSLLGRRPWSVHSLQGVPRSWFRADARFGYVHCNAINTGWKWQHRSAPDADRTAGMLRDDALAAELRATLGA